MGWGILGETEPGSLQECVSLAVMCGDKKEQFLLQESDLLPSSRSLAHMRSDNRTAISGPTLSIVESDLICKQVSHSCEFQQAKNSLVLYTQRMKFRFILFYLRKKKKI